MEGPGPNYMMETFRFVFMYSFITSATSSGKRNVTVCPFSFLTLIQCAAHTHRDSPGGSMRRGQRTF